MTGFTLHFKTEEDAVKFSSRIKRYAKRTKFLSISDLYFLMGSTSEDVRGENKYYGWTYNLLSGVKIEKTDEQYDLIMPTFIKQRNVINTFPTRYKGTEKNKLTYIKRSK